MPQGTPTELPHSAKHLSGKSYATDAATFQSTFREEAGKYKTACSSVRPIGHSFCLAMILSAHFAHAIVCRHGWKTVSTGDSMQISQSPSCSAPTFEPQAVLALLPLEDPSR